MVTTTLCTDDNVEVDMGAPSTEPRRLATGYIGTERRGRAPRATACTTNDQDVEFVAVSVGNPHAVVFVDDISAAPVTTLGAAIGAHAAFPNGVNVGFCQVVDPGFARLRVFERGAGETRACGSGACAAVVAGHLTRALGERVKVSLPGGKVRISWQGGDGAVKMLGPAQFVFDGELSY